MRRWLNLRFVLGGSICLVAIAVAIFAPQLAPHDPLIMDAKKQLLVAAAGHPMGTDEFGRDILSRLLWGTRASLLVSFGSVAMAAVTGTALGLAAGYLGGITEQLTMRVVDVVLCFPPILLAMTVVGMLGSGVTTLIVVIGLLYAPRFARLIAAVTRQVRSQPFVEAAQAMGASDVRVIAGHILPNVMPPLIVQASLSAAGAILLESGLSFLGLGVQPPTPSWGLMISQARGYMQLNPGYVAWPSAVIAGLIWAINTLGDALRDTLDPQLRGR